MTTQCKVDPTHFMQKLSWQGHNHGGHNEKNLEYLICKMVHVKDKNKKHTSLNNFICKINKLHIFLILKQVI